MSEHPTVSVVVPTRDRPDHLRTCLAALAQAVRPGDEVVVVDSASADPASVAAVAAEAGVRLVRLDQPGASRARNAGWQAASGSVVAFTDDDCLARPGFAAAYAAAFASDDVVLAWGPVTVSQEGTGAADLSGSGPTAARHGDDLGLLGGSGNLAVRREALLAVDGFDDLLGPGMPLPAAEDKDLLERVLRRGGTGVLVPEAVVEHVVWRGRRASLRVAFAYGVGQSAFRHKLRSQGVDPSVFPDGELRVPVRQAWQAVRDGYQTGVLLSAWRLAGMLAGRRRVRGLTVEAGHLRG